MKFLLFLVTYPIFAACTGGSPTWTSTADSTSVQTCINNAAASGDTINISSGSATWSSTGVVTVNNKSLTLAGATTCTGSGSEGLINCTDNTNITITAQDGLTVSNSTTTFVRVTGITFIDGSAGVSLGIVGLFGPGFASGRPTGNNGNSFRIDHCHFQMAIGGSVNLFMGDGYGIADHNWFQDTTTTALGAAPIGTGGDSGTEGYLNWNLSTNPGTNQAIYIEDNYYTTSHQNVEGLVDCVAAAIIVVRFNKVVGNELGGCHGTDSGGRRGAILMEDYNNSVDNTGGSGGVNGGFDTRGGTLLFFNNSLLGSNGWFFIQLRYYRVLGNVDSGQWGIGGAALNWTPVSNVPSNPGSDMMSLNAPDWQANTVYAANAVIGPTSNNTAGWNYQNQGSSCTSGGTRPNPFNQTFPRSTTTDNTCTWTNVGGTTAATTTGSGFCAVNPDTACNVNATCNALSGGDTCTRFFDTNGGVYPFRDQPGRVHNQVLIPNYEWLNTGAGLASPLFSTDSTTTSIIQNNVDYYGYVSSFNGSSGTGSGKLSAIPATCTTGVAYWATDQGAWNGNCRAAQGVLYKCTSTNTWSVYYTPYTYPHPLVGTGLACASGTPAVSGSATNSGNSTK